MKKLLAILTAILIVIWMGLYAVYPFFENFPKLLNERLILSFFAALTIEGMLLLGFTIIASIRRRMWHKLGLYLIFLEIIVGSVTYGLYLNFQGLPFPFI